MSRPVLPNFGYEWHPKADSLLVRHLIGGRDNVGFGAFYHRRALIQALWPNDYEWNDWNERRLRGFCKYNWNTWLGPGASCKSTDAARFAVEFYLEAPSSTSVVIVSTTFKMLRRRIWSEIVRYHESIPTSIEWKLDDGSIKKESMGYCGELLDSDTMIRWKKGDPKHGIFGIAVEEGPVEQAVNNIFGIHPDRYLLVLDEMQGIPEAIMKGTSNITKNRVSIGLGIGNPENMMNPLIKASEPEGGWGTVERGVTPEWETLGGYFKGPGLAQFFDGRTSPAIREPKKFPKMINQEMIDAHLKGVRGNWNDATVWSQVIGWPPPLGIEQTVLDDSIVITFKLRDRPVWTGSTRNWASLDPSFEGGDKCILTLGRCGEVSDDDGDRWVIALTEQVEVPKDSMSVVPIHYQIARWVRDYLRPRGYRPHELALDSTGEGGGLHSIFRQEWGDEVVGVEFGGKPSDRPINQLEQKTAAEAYDRKATELNLQIREFALGNGLRGLSDDIIKQACSRRTELKNAKTRVEPKGSRIIGGQKVKGFKDRMGFSPDEMDSLAVGVELCRQFGAVASVKDAPKTVSREREEQPEPDEFDERNYLQEDSYAEAFI